MQKELLVPGSILIGCTIIGAGLYFGLSARPEPAAGPFAGAVTAAADTGAKPAGSPPANVAVTTPAPQPPPMGAPMMPGLAGPSVPPAVQAAVEKAAAEALAAEKKNNLVPKCWKPALEKQPQPAVAKYSLDMTFDPQGTQITFGMNEERSALRSDVAACIQSQNITLRIAPPGFPVRVLLPLEFP